MKFIAQVLVKLPQSNEFFHIFEYQLKDTDKLRFETKEISTIKWLTILEIKVSMEKKDLEWYPRPIQIVQALY